MTPEEEERIRYQFQGYQLPKIQLDETGPAYVVLHPHPYYYNQPEYWGKPFFYGHPGGFDNNPRVSGRLYPFMPNDEDT